MRPESRSLVRDAIRALEAVGAFISGRTLSEFDGDMFFRSAVERQLEIAGEALSQLRRQDPDTVNRIADSAEAIALRNVLAHGYATVNSKVIWLTAQDDAPRLLANLRAILPVSGDSDTG